MELLQDNGAILKVVIMPTVEEQSIIQGFNMGILNAEVASILFLLTKAPKEISDIFIKEENKANLTLNRQNPVFLISKDNFDNIPNIYQSPFCIIFCIESDFPYVSNIKNRFDVPPIICSNNKYADLQLRDVDSIYSFDKSLYSRFKLNISKVRINPTDKKILKKLKRRSRCFYKSKLNSTLNNATTPNELLIESLGYVLSPPKKIKDGSSKREFIEKIIHSVDAYKGCLNDLEKKHPTEALIFSSGMHSFLFDRKNKIFDLLLEDLSSVERKFLVQGVLQNPGYSGIMLRFDNNEKEIFKSSKLKFLISLRHYEMRLTTAAISLLSFNKNIPAIRMPNGINNYYSYLKEIEDLAKNIGIDSDLFIAKSKAFNTLIKRSLGFKLREHISNNYQKLCFVCDVPLDWIRFNNIPVMFSHEISRINTTPGNILLQNASFFPRVIVKASELKNILILRSFEPDDHLKFILEDSLEIFKRRMPNLNYEIIDIKTKIEFIDALNQYQGYILIMDCHGDHGGNENNGWLIIGEDKVDTWSLKKVARIPPIVILSACLTSALSGSHASVANGFLLSGALSVIGTLLPVNAIDSAVFVSRLIYRFYEFPSTLSQKFTHANLRLFLSIFLKMSYASDLLRGFEREGLIPNNSWEEDSISISIYINMLKNDWYDYVINKLVKLTGLTAQDIINLIDNKFFITETMCYSQIGFPDSITISLKE